MKKPIFLISLFTIIILLVQGIASAALEGTIRQMATNQSEYVGKSVEITGEIDVTSHYGYGYLNRKGTHYAFKLTDNTGTAYVYVMKGKLRSTFLKDKIISTKEPVPGKFVIRIIEDRFKKNRSGTVYAELRFANCDDGIKSPKPEYIRSSRPYGVRSPVTKQIYMNNQVIKTPIRKRAIPAGTLTVKMQENKPISLNRRDPEKITRTNQEQVVITQKNYSEKISSWVDKDGKINFTNSN